MALVPLSSNLNIRRLKGVVLAYTLMTVLALFFLFPVLFMLVSSIKNEEVQVLADMSSLWAFVPRGDIGIQNYLDCFHAMPFHRFMLNSLFIVGTTVVLGLFVNSFIAYALARFSFRGRAFLLSVIIALIIVPLEAVAVPMLLLVNVFGWLDSYHVQIVPFIADALSIYLFYQFFIDFPKELEQAARVDGAGRFRIYWSIVLPLSRPVFATVAILQFMIHWGDFLWPLMVTRGETYRPLPVAMQQFFTMEPRLWGDIMAFAAMITVPVLVLFCIFQKWFVKSAASTGIKG